MLMFEFLVRDRAVRLVHFLNEQEELTPFGRAIRGCDNRRRLAPHGHMRRVDVRVLLAPPHGRCTGRYARLSCPNSPRACRCCACGLRVQAARGTCGPTHTVWYWQVHMCVGDAHVQAPDILCVCSTSLWRLGSSCQARGDAVPHLTRVAAEALGPVLDPAAVSRQGRGENMHARDLCPK